MHLAFVGIRHYRGIQLLELPLDATTALIGENAYGKSNLLDALLVCLGAGAEDGTFAFLPEDFHAHEPIEIRLGFRETSADEWNCPGECALLQPYVYTGRRGDRRITIEIRATLDADRRSITVASHFIDGSHRPTSKPVAANVIELLRKRSPFLLLKADRYFTRPSRAASNTRSLVLEERLAEEIRGAYQTFARNHEATDQSERQLDLERGLAAARAYVERFGGTRLRERVRSFLPEHEHSGTGVSLAARSVALMLIVGALLDAKGQRVFGNDAMPTLAIEDAEAYLHPVVLASVAAVVQAIPAQKIITTNSGELLSMLPLPALRRLVRTPERTEVHRLRQQSLSNDELRRVGYHVRANRGSSLFARSWLLVEGETEFWLMPQLAELIGCDFALEGVRLMEFAQCGVDPLIKLADDLGIPWHILCDGDAAGQGYATTARSFLEGRPAERHMTLLRDRDIEHCLWDAGYASVYREAVQHYWPHRYSPHRVDRRTRTDNPTPTIERALRARSKPGMAVAVAEAAQARGAEGVPEPLARAILLTTELARTSA